MQGAPASSNKYNMKLWLGIGGGCLLLVLAACIASYIWCKNAAEEVGTIVGVEGTRIGAVFALQSVQRSCNSDPTGAGAANNVHPSAMPQLQGVLCQVNEQTIAAVRDSCSNQPRPAPCSMGQSLEGSGSEAYAENLGIEPENCFKYTSGSAVVVMCSIDGATKLVHLENPTAVQ